MFYKCTLLLIIFMALLSGCSDKDSSTSPAIVFNWEGTFTVSNGYGTIEIEMPDPLPDDDFTAEIKWEDEDGDYGEGTMQFTKTGDSIIAIGSKNGGLTGWHVRFRARMCWTY